MLIFSFVIQNEMEELLIFMNSERGDSCYALNDKT